MEIAVHLHHFGMASLQTMKAKVAPTMNPRTVMNGGRGLSLPLPLFSSLLPTSRKGWAP